MAKKDYDYKLINELLPCSSACFYGKVISYKPPSPTRGTDYIMTLVVRDESFPPAIPLDDGLSVLIFKSQLAEFPQVQATGDIVQFRHFKVQNFGPNLQALSTNWSRTSVFCKADNDQWKCRSGGAVSEQEEEVLNGIDRAVTAHSSNVPLPDGSRSTLRIHNIQPNQFFDFVGEVVKVLPENRSAQISLLLTDYTESSLIRINPINFDLTSDYEHRLLLTTFWDNHVPTAMRVPEGSIIRVNNLHARVLSSATDYDFDFNAGGGLIAVLHGDRSSAEKIFVLDESDPEAQLVLSRKKQLLHSSQLSSQTCSSPIKTNLNTTTSVKQSTETIRLVQPSPFDGSPVKRLNLMGNSQIPTQLMSPVKPPAPLFQNLPQTVAVCHSAEVSAPSLIPEDPPLILSGLSQSQSFSKHPLTSKSHARSLCIFYMFLAILHEQITISPIERVITSPVCPSKFVIKGRVTGYQPANIADFVKYFCNPCQRAHSFSEDDPVCHICGRSLTQLTFILSLTINDGVRELPIIVAHQDAIRFFNGMLPTNLHTDVESRAYVKEVINKLMSTPRPASFCIKSYTTPNNDLRRYRVFDTILAIL